MRTKDVELVQVDTGQIEVDLMYATENNFMGQRLYAAKIAFLHPDAYAALLNAADILKEKGLRLRLYDAFRPAEIQVLMFAHTPDPNFVAPPERGSNHTRAIAVDVTLIDQNGQALDMGTAIDTFTEESWHACKSLPENVLNNREILRQAMETAGFTHEPNEWWHYQLPNVCDYPLLAAEHAPGLLTCAAE